MIDTLNSSWKAQLNHEISKPYFQDLLLKIESEYESKVCYPKKEHIFSAFNFTPFSELKVVIIGQDPYHGIGQANGLCFSVNEDVAPPPSLLNIFKEINQDLNIPFPNNGDLSRWAKQGILLLNATLTVEAHKAGSHLGLGWEKFTDEVIRRISNEKENIIFLLWGGFAKKKAKLIDKDKHHILTSGHPSPLSANRGYWFGNKHFSQVNEILKSKSLPPIQW
ncbi:uracil-DNA glycosylase [Brumimicrobium aurantiacum]|uniref:Uracil-DNA glycosylase n=1 Tax=Brumimicrobium aurantiacum TaxID=1737063 RepID=A0A3E1EZY4_9FLAO|nr:uracil-DNA glycosylase [Brumimicrobium aurantiacum]RFC55120.1 uracil-DNA glycosylase [Brumimicrobium aurantiacum]